MNPVHTHPPNTLTFWTLSSNLRSCLLPQFHCLKNTYTHKQRNSILPSTLSLDYGPTWRTEGERCTGTGWAYKSWVCGRCCLASTDCTRRVRASTQDMWMDLPIHSSKRLRFRAYLRHRFENWCNIFCTSIFLLTVHAFIYVTRNRSVFQGCSYSDEFK
jgi:hypothetical protein